MFKSYELTSESQVGLNTEIRFLIASSRIDGEELVKLGFSCSDKDASRIMSCIIKVLRVLKKEKSIQFYANSSSFAENSTEAIFLLNKYGDYIEYDSNDEKYVYVKL